MGQTHAQLPVMRATRRDECRELSVLLTVADAFFVFQCRGLSTCLGMLLRRRKPKGPSSMAVTWFIGFVPVHVSCYACILTRLVNILYRIFNSSFRSGVTHTQIVNRSEHRGRNLVVATLWVVVEWFFTIGLQIDLFSSVRSGKPHC